VGKIIRLTFLGLLKLQKNLIIVRFLVEYNKKWIIWYDEERKSILSAVPNIYIKRIWRAKKIIVLLTPEKQTFLNNLKSIKKWQDTN